MKLQNKITGSKANQVPYRQNAGARAEQLALAYLTKQGLKLVETNYRCALGEIDLVLLHQQTSPAPTLVFAEVRYRRTASFMLPEETVDVHKQRKVLAAAKHFLRKHPACHGAMCFDAIRFDVVTLLGDFAKPEIKWLQAAFEDLD